jgi:outer membrane protein assembly factor BamB/TolA-binding protein
LKLPPAAFEAYRAARDPRAAELLDRAAAAPGDPRPLEELVIRYPLSSHAPKALLRLADLRIERGELEQAGRLLADFSPPPGADDAPVRARAEFVRARLEAARAAFSTWPMEGGAPDRSARGLAAPLPGAPRFALPYPSSEVGPAVREGFARRGKLPPLVYLGATAGDAVVWCDSKVVVAAGEADGKVRWIYGAVDPSDEREDADLLPERLDNAAFSPAIEGGRVFATLDRNTPALYRGEEPGRAADWRIVALDLRTGRLLWDAGARKDMESIAREARYVTPPLAAGGRVYVGGILGSASLQAFAIALDAATGEPLWRTFVGSASPDDFRALGCQAAPLLEARGLLYFQTNLGSIAALDPRDGAIRWEARYRGTPVASQKRVIRDELRWRLAAPRAIGGTLVAAPQDASLAIGYDLESGLERWRFERDRLERVAGVSRGRIVFSGPVSVLALDPASGRVVWERNLGPDAAARGAGFATEDRVYIPARDGIFILSAADGTIEDVFRFLPGESAGNLLVGPRGVFLFGTSGLLAFGERETSIAEARRAADLRPNDARAMLALGAALARYDADAFAALGALDRAIEIAERSPAPEREVAREAREIAFAVGRRAAAAAKAAGKVDEAFRLAERAARVAPPTPEGVDFMRALAADLEAAGRTREAVEALLRICVFARDVPVSLGPGIEAAAGAWARRRLVELRAKGPADAFAAIDAEASRAYEAAKKAATPEAFEKVVSEFPTTPREADALLSLALLYERDLANLAIRFYSLHRERFPAAPEAPAVLYKLALLYERTRRSDEARRVLEEIRDRFPDRTIGAGPQGRVELGKFAREALAATAASPEDRPALPLGAPEEMRPSFQTATDLDDEEPSLFLPRGIDRDRAPLFFAIAGTAIEARAVETGARAWRHEALAGFNRAAAGVAGRSLVLSSNRAIEAIDVETGRLLWSWGAQALFSAEKGAAPPEKPQPEAKKPALEGEAGEEPEPPIPDPDGPQPERPTPDGGAVPPAPNARVVFEDPDPVKGVLVAADRVVAVVNRDVFALDASNGKLLWRARRTEAIAGDPLAAPGGACGRAVLTVEAGAKLIGLDLETGSEAYAVTLDAPDPRITLRPVASRTGRIFCVVGSSEVFAVDGAAGTVVWRRKLAWWPRELCAEKNGAALCVLPYGGHDQPRLTVLDGATGGLLFEDRREKSRVGQVAFDEDRLYVFSGDFVAAKLRAIDWRTGAERWTWQPQRGHSFGEMTVARDHVLMPQVGPTGPPVVYVIDRERGMIYTSFSLEGRRIVSASVQRGTVLVSTNRGIFGFARLDMEKLREEQAEIAIEAALHPERKDLRVLLADRRYKRGDIDGAIATLEAALGDDSLTLDQYELFYRQMLGVLEARAPSERIEVAKLSRPPEIDGDLRDWWPLHQSVRLQGPRNVAPIQGYGRLGIWRGDDDLSGVVYLGWDQKNFYFALDVDDSSLIPYDSDAPTWKGDCLLIALDPLGNEGDFFQRDDNLVSLALTLPKKQKPDEQKEDEPEGKYFVKRKDDGSGAIYEAAIPWKAFNDKGTNFDLVRGPKKGTTFGFNLVITDDDDNQGARKALSWTPSIALHRDKARLWNGFVPKRFAKIVLK